MSGSVSSYETDYNILQEIWQHCRQIMKPIKETVYDIHLPESKKEVMDLIQQVTDLFQWLVKRLVHMITEDLTGMTVMLFVIIVSSLVVMLVKKYHRKDQGYSDCHHTDRQNADSIKLRICNLAKTSYKPDHMAECLRLLRETDVSVNERILPNGCTPFLCACMSGNWNLVNEMLKMGADVSVLTRFQDSPLYLAVYVYLHRNFSDLQTIKLLVQSGCDVNVQTNHGYTVLHQAAREGSVALTKYLLKNGADPHRKTHCGILPADIAVNSGNRAVANLLKFHNLDTGVKNAAEVHTPPLIHMGLMTPKRNQVPRKQLQMVHSAMPIRRSHLKPEP